MTNGTPVKVANVKLVVSMTGINSSVLLKFKILDNDNAGAVLFEREYLDTAAADPMQVGTDDPPGSYLGRNGRFLLALFRDQGWFDPDIPLPPLAKVEVVYDNAEVTEYYPPHLEIAQATNGVDLTWQLPKEEHTVVAADQLPGPWCPCPQAHTRTGDAFCLAMPCQSLQKFFKLTPGTQFTDDFSTVKPIWMSLLQDPGEDWFVTNGVLRLTAIPSQYAGYALLPLGTSAAATVRDFYPSVDILEWVTSTNTWLVLSFVGRGRLITPNSGNGRPVMMLDCRGLEASPGSRSTCSGCGGNIHAKCDQIVAWHWARVFGVDTQGRQVTTFRERCAGRRAAT